MDERIGLVMYKWGTMYQIPFTFKKTQDYTMLNMITDKISAEVQDNMITELRDSQVVDTFLLGIFPGKCKLQDELPLSKFDCPFF